MAKGLQSLAKRAVHKGSKSQGRGVARGKGARTLGGRALDLDKLALDHVLDWAVTEKWLTAKPDLKWERKAKAPKVVRLISEADLDALCKANVIHTRCPRVHSLQLANACLVIMRQSNSSFFPVVFLQDRYSRVVTSPPRPDATP